MPNQPESFNHIRHTLNLDKFSSESEYKLTCFLVFQFTENTNYELCLVQLPLLGKKVEALVKIPVGTYTNGIINYAMKFVGYARKLIN